ncbi:hypothetical protein M8U73_23925, partial [Enterobacter hormaechei]|nr:hypothetical protein [Enterobacter hormaechei]MDF3783670.1 hypothetical protein [Enterobacter hormaechei]
TYRVSDSQDFWLTPNGRYLSQAEYSSPADTLQKLTGVVSGEDPDQVRKNAVRVRVFRVESENSHKGACLPVRAVVENDIHNSIHHDAQLFSVNSHSVLDTAAQSTFIETGEVVSMVVGPLRVMVATSLALFTGAFARPLFLLL